VNQTALLNRDDDLRVDRMSPSISSTTESAAHAAPLPLAIRLLRRLNPLIVALLRSPLHGMLSRSLLVLTYVGTTTGARRVVPLSYVELGGRVYLCTRTSAWWRNLRNARPVEIQLRGERITAIPAIVDFASVEALDAFRAFLSANPKTGEMLYDVHAGADRRPIEADLRREVRRSVVVRLDLRPAGA
jgi:hypothetical protein